MSRQESPQLIERKTGWYWCSRNK